MMLGLGAGKAAPEGTPVPAEGPTVAGEDVSSCRLKRFERLSSARSNSGTDGVAASQL